MNPQNQTIRNSRRKVSRRVFLRGMTLAGAGFAAACYAAEIAIEPTPIPTPTPARVLRSPQAPAGVPETGESERAISLDQFLELSALLTGFDQLNRAQGQIYLQSLLSEDAGGPALNEVYTAALSENQELPEDLQTLTDAGFFEDVGTAELADRIIEMWYTGIYTADGEDHVATFVDALAWKALHFTKPLTICGEFGFWADPPLANISPTFQYTPIPTEEPS